MDNDDCALIPTTIIALLSSTKTTTIAVTAITATMTAVTTTVVTTTTMTTLTVTIETEPGTGIDTITEFTIPVEMTMQPTVDLTLDQNTLYMRIVAITCGQIHLRCHRWRRRRPWLELPALTPALGGARGVTYQLHPALVQSHRTYPNSTLRQVEPMRHP